MYTVGGALASYGSVHFAQINGDQTLGAWVETTNLGSDLYQFGGVVDNDSGWVYVIGGVTHGGPLSGAQFARIEADGQLSAWTPTTPLPRGVDAQGSALYRGVIYQVGSYGAAGDVHEWVYYDSIGTDGSLWEWHQATSLRVPLSNPYCVAYEDHLYSFGGYLGNGVISDSSYVAEIHADGSLGEWLVTTNLPLPLFGCKGYVLGNDVFITGGAGSSYTSSAIYKATFMPGGGVGSWTYVGDLPVQTAQHGLVMVNSTVYMLGGENQSGYLDSVFFSRVNSGFLASIVIHDNGGRTDSLEFGTAPGATNGIDSLYGESECPPFPPLGAFDVRWLIPGTQGSKRDIRDTLGSARVQITYTAAMQPGGSGYPMTLHWNPLQLPHGAFVLSDALGGLAFSIDMRLQDSLVVSSEGINSFQIIYDRRSATHFVPDSLWNLVSVPLRVIDYRKASLFPGSISNAFAYTESGYAPRDTLDNKNGYWLKFSGPRSIWMFGEPRLNDTLDLIQGWNMIGSLSETVATAAIVEIPSGVVTSQYFGYAGAYYASATIEPIYGYWVKASQPGQIVLNASTAQKRIPMSHALPASSSSLHIADRSGASQNLFIALGPIDNLDYFEMPPIPPGGVFDVRFVTNRMLEAVNEGETRTIPIQVSSARYPLRISWDIEDQTLTSSLLLGTQEYNFAGKRSIEVLDPKTSLTLKVGGHSELPREFALRQNYPNPFNPSTTIKYDLPVDARVSLKVFNVIGQEIVTLVDEDQKAGYRSIQWKPSNLASGVYFYRLEAGGFVASRKVLLLK